jgi:predicted ATPase/class 3 adenylate cyclase
LAPEFDASKALLATDVVDSTQLNDRVGDPTMAALWEAHDQCARRFIRAWRGREVGRSDGFLALFDSPADAAACAIAYHAGLAALATPLVARAAIHFGAVRLRTNDPTDIAQGSTPFEIDGIALPLVMRVLSVAAGGQTLVTAAAWAAMDEPHWRHAKHGFWRLKGLAEPVELIEIGDSSAAFVPPSDAAKAYRVAWVQGLWIPVQDVPHSLPAERDEFVGRERLLASLASRFSAGATLITVLGAGGIGKTRLALRYARSWRGEYPGGAWFCDLSRATTGDGVVHGVAQGLEMPLGADDPIRQIVDAAAGRGDCLLILDNAEQVLRYIEPLLVALMHKAPRARLLITSRAVLGITGEQILELPSLSPSEAAELFRSRARDAGALSDATLDDCDVHPLVDLLDRLPLAIELAAARTRLMPPRALLDRMDERFRLLKRIGGRRDRQSTLRATLDWSWDLLAEEERSALQQLSAFEGGFSLGAVEAVIALERDDPPWTGDLLQALIDQSLVRRLPQQRFDMLRSVRDYAAERLSASGSKIDAWQRHWLHFSAISEQAATADGCADLENIVSACRRAVAGTDGAAAGRCLERAGAALQLTGPVRMLLGMASDVLGMPRLPAAQQATALRVMGNAQFALGRRSDAILSYRQGITVSAATGDEFQLARLRCALADPLTRSGERAEARTLLDDAWRSATRLADSTLQYIALNGLGTLAMNEARLDDARQHFEDGLAIAIAIAHRRWQGGIQGNLGVVHHLRGSSDEASACYRESLAIALEIGDRHWAANARCNLGLLLSEAGHRREAEPELMAVCTEARELGLSLLEATALCNLGLLLLDTSKVSEARAAFAAASEIADRLGDHALGAVCRRGLGQALMQCGQLDAAADYLARAEELAERAGDTAERARVSATRLELDTLKTTAAPPSQDESAEKLS